MNRDSEKFWDRYVVEYSAKPRHTYSSIFGLSPQPPASRQEALAIKLLLDAIKTLETVVRKKRGQVIIDTIRAESGKHGFNVGALAHILEMLKGEIGEKKRGPKPQIRRPGKAGRPRLWTPIMYRSILHWYERGAEALKREGKSVTNVTALKRAFQLEDAALQARERSRQDVLDRLAKDAAKRLSDARRALRK